MEYVYAALILNESGEEINEENITSVLESAGVDVEESRVKALVAALEDVDIDEAVAEAAAVPAGGAPAGGAAPAEGGADEDEADAEDAGDDEDEEVEETSDVPDTTDDDEEEDGGEALGDLFG